MGSNLDAFEKIGMALDALSHLEEPEEMAGGVFDAMPENGTFGRRCNYYNACGIGILCSREAARNLWAISAALEDVENRPTESINLWVDSFPNGIKIFDVSNNMRLLNECHIGNVLTAKDSDYYEEEQEKTQFENRCITIDENYITFSCSEYARDKGDYVSVSWPKEAFLDLVEKALDENKPRF